MKKPISDEDCFNVIKYQLEQLKSSACPECNHKWIEVTIVADLERKYICNKCGKEKTEERYL